MENWRLSKIEEELGKLNLDSSAQSSEHSRTNTPPREAEVNDDVKIIIRPAYKKTARSKHHQDTVNKADAVRRIKEKYDSPGAVTKVDCDAERSTPNKVPSSTYHQPDWEHPADDSTRTRSPDGDPVDRQSARGPDVLCAGNTASENRAESGEGFALSARPQLRAIPVFPLRGHQSDDMPRQNGTCAGIRPSTAANPLYSSFRGQIFRNSNENSDNYPSQIDSRNHATMPDSTDTSYSLPPMNAPVLQPFGASSRSSTIYLQDNVHLDPHDQFSIDIFPAPPPDFFLSRGVVVGLELPAAQKCQPETTCPSQTGGYSSALNARYATAPNKGEDLVVDVNSFLSGQIVYDSTPQNSGEAKPQCESFVPAETHRFEQLTSSHGDCYPPRYGTLKASRHNPNSPGAKCDFSPPANLGLTDEERGQVELFYRSHKTKVFAARCQAKLYFGSARRHSSVLPSGGPRASAEPPDNWVFAKTGIPVLVLDTGESRRQRRLHVILAERGSGFVLWRDAVDHLTTYSPSAEAGFHTMHLSKDHTKLAGIYFADPVHAGHFFDRLSGFTSDPDDPLLNLSLGAKRRKASASTKRKGEKRRPIRREDISLPCCFNHVTKLDRADGLNLLEADQRLHD